MIPDGWERGLMGELIELISGQHIEAQFYNEDKIGIPYLTGPSDFQDGKINITKYTEQPKVLCESGDILITVKGSGTGKSIIANQKCCIGRQLMAVRATKLDRTFAFYIIKSKEAKYGDTASGLIPGIAREHILETSLLIPPLLEQCKIAEVLGVWDESIDLLEKLIGKTRSRKQGLMQQLLTGNKRFKEFEGSEWKKVEFGQVVLDTKLGTTKRGMGKGSNIPLLKMGNMNWGGLNFNKLEYIDEEILESEDFILKSGDFLFNTRNTPELVGKSAVWNDRLPKAVFDNNINRIRFHDSVNSSFVCLQLTYGSGKKKIHAASSGTTSVSAIYWKNLQKINLFLPSLPEQEKIAAVLSAADEEISTLEKQLAAYKQQKLGLMQQLLTGRIRI